MQQIRRLIGEVHRRSLWQVLGIYGLGSWAVYQVALGLTEGIGLPQWLPGMVVVLILAGLPIVLATAFVQHGLPIPDELGRRAPAADALDPTLFPHDSASPDEVPLANDPQQRRGGWLGRALTWRRSLVAGVIAFSLLAAGTTGWVGLRALGIGPMGSLLAAGVLAQSDRILIADFESRGADTTLAAVVTEAFRIDFARSTLVRAADPTQMREVLRRMQRPDVTRLDGELAREIALRAGIGAYVTGELAAAGRAYVLTARLIATESGEVLAAFRERARDEEDVISAIDRLSRAVRERTGESLKAIHRSQPLERVTTPSLEALQKYTQALRATGWEGDAGRGYRLLQEAVALDSAFAAAHRAIAIRHSNADQPELALAAMERAFRFQDRLSDLERDLAYGAYHSIRAEHAQSAAAYERALQRDPQNFSALNNLALDYERLFEYDRAEVYLRRAIEADTARFFGYTNLGELQVFVGQFDAARQSFETAIARAPESAWPTVNQALLPFVAGNYEEAEKKLRHLIDSPESSRGTRDRADIRLTRLLLVLGRLAEAERRVEAMARANGDADAVERRLADHRIATTFAIVRDVGRAREMVRRFGALIGDSADAGALVGFASACAFTGDVRCARESLARAGRSGPPQPWTSFDVYVAHGALALAEQDYERAVRLFRGIQDRRCPRCEESFVGLTFERMQQPDSAIAAYERYLAVPSLDRVFTDAYDLAFVLERLGALYEQRNDRVNASRYYARLAELWRNADPVLQPRVANALARVRQLQPDR